MECHIAIEDTRTQWFSTACECVFSTDVSVCEHINAHTECTILFFSKYARSKFNKAQ